MKRLLTASVLVPLFFYIIVAAPYYVFLASLAVIGLLCYFEFTGIAVRHLRQPNGLQHNPIGYAAGLVLLVLPGQEVAFLCLLAIVLMIQSLRARDMADCLPVGAFSFLGVIYIFGAWRCAVGLREMNPYWLLFGLGCNWLGDTFAFYGGRAFGRRKLAPVISPGKSWEGTISSLVGMVLVCGLLLNRYAPQLGWFRILALCVVANLAGQLGDLCESAFKRGAGVKDSGNLLPGHGGWLDRVDSSLFSVPVVYWLLHQTWFMP